MNWKLKVAAFHAFERMPYGRDAYYLTQLYVTRSLPRRLGHGEAKNAQSLRHIAAFRRHGADLARMRAFEFGAGWDLYNALVFYCFGIKAQIVIDLNAYARPSLVNHVIAFLRDDPPPGAIRVPGQAVGDALGADLRRLYGIDYRAPNDAGATGLPAGAVDLISTTSTLEHIPPRELDRIISECRRILAPGGLMSMSVDYSDHYAHSCRDITPCNFLRYDDAEWERYNPGIHYQNRLRHPDIRALFLRCGFEILEEETKISAEGLAFLRGIDLPERFAGYRREDLAIREGWFLLRPADEGSRDSMDLSRA